MSTQSASNATQSLTNPQDEINVNQLGEFIDGWWDLIEGLGEQSTAIRSTLKQHVDQRNLPNVTSEERIGYVTRFGPGSEEKRHYLILRMNPGITTAIHVGARGNDLYVTWRTHIRSVVNRWLMVWVLAIAAGLGLITGGMPWLFASGEPIFSLGGFLISSLIFLVVELALIVGAGWLRHRNYWAFFFIEARLFDADNAIAMSISAHQSLLHALGEAGVDMNMLRSKNNFRSGRRRERI